MQRHITFLLIFVFTTIGLCQSKLEDASRSQRLNMIYQPPDLVMSTRFSDEDGSQAIDSDERCTLTLNVENHGKGKAYNLAMKVEGRLPDYVTINKTSVNIGLLAPGKSQAVQFVLTGGADVRDGKFDLIFRLNEKFDKVPAPLQISIETREPIPPELDIVDFSVTDDMSGLAYGNGDGKPAKGETIEVTLLVQNIGQGDAFGVAANVVLGGSLVQMSRMEHNLGDLRAGDSRDVKVAFSIPEDYRGRNDLPFEVKLTEQKKRYGTSKSLPLELNTSTGSSGRLQPRQVEITARTRKNQGGQVQRGSLVESVDIGIPETGNNNPDAFAVVIGNRDYSSADIDNVDFAHNDAQAMKNYLTRVLGYRAGNILYYENATFATMRDVFGTDHNPKGKLYNMVKPDKSDVFIYYSGHGAPHPDEQAGYFVPADCGISPTSLENNGYALTTFYNNLKKLPAKSITVVLDACFSGVSDASPIGLKIKDPAQTLEKGNVFSSARSNQISNWYPETGHSLFTYFFLKALKKAATENETLTTGDLYDRISDNSEGVPYWARRLYNGREQNPVFKGDEGTLFLR